MKFDNVLSTRIIHDRFRKPEMTETHSKVVWNIQKGVSGSPNIYSAESQES